MQRFKQCSMQKSRGQKMKGTMCTREHVLISPRDLNRGGGITVHLNAPETDSKGQTLHIIPSPLFLSSLLLPKSPASQAGQLRQKCKGCCPSWQNLQLMCNEWERAIAISLSQSSSSCLNRHNNFIGNNWQVTDIWVQVLFSTLT